MLKAIISYLEMCSTAAKAISYAFTLLFLLGFVTAASVHLFII